jgi:ribosomal protein S18 acetylase RimI-like enzyme
MTTQAAGPAELLPPNRLDEAAGVLARAFVDDPVWAWIVPGRERREALLPWLFRVSLDGARDDGTLWVTQDGIRAVARWLGPGRSRAQPRLGSLPALALAPFRLRSGVRRAAAFGRAHGKLRKEIAPGPHWYLAGIGVDPDSQNRGLGGVVMAPGLDAADAERLPAALVTATRRNHSFYARHGFEVAAVRRVPNGGPELWGMVREPLSGSRTSPPAPV